MSSSFPINRLCSPSESIKQASSNFLKTSADCKSCYNEKLPQYRISECNSNFVVLKKTHTQKILEKKFATLSALHNPHGFSN